MRTKVIASIAAAAASAFLVVGCSDNAADSSMDGHAMGSRHRCPRPKQARPQSSTMPT